MHLRTYPTLRPDAPLLSSLLTSTCNPPRASSQPPLAAGEGIEPSFLRYSYYTAGSGGAGPTILETSFLLAGEPVTVYKDGQAFTLPPISNRREVDFGPGGVREGSRSGARREKEEEVGGWVGKCQGRTGWCSAAASGHS